jgi:hypothetical protein
VRHFRVGAAARLQSLTVSEHTQRLDELAERLSNAKEFL